MGQMDALTGMELEAARRREVVLEDLVDARQARAARPAERRHDRREPAWLAAVVPALTAGLRLVRG